MTRQMQWEVLHSECCARSSFAKRGEQVEPSNLLLTLCTAVKTSLRTVLTPCLHPGRMVRTLAQQAKGSSNSWEGGEIRKRETEAYFSMPKSQEEGTSEQG